MTSIRGSCLCGGVRFELDEPFTSVVQCHCTNCKKISGGTGTVNGRAPTSVIRILSGEELLHTFQPAEGTAKTFCSECGSNLFGGGWPTSEHASVRLSAIDTHFDRKPEAHNFVRSVAPWEVLVDDGIAQYDVRAPS